MRFFVWLFLGVSLVVAGCGSDCPDTGSGLGSTCGQANPSPSPSPGDPSTGTNQLYISDAGSSSLLRFAGATSLSGNVVPQATVNGQLTQLSAPGYLFYDAPNDRLYVANTGGNSILIFDKFSTLSGNSNNVAPTRFLSGPNTQLDRPLHVQLDSTRNLLYVANGGPGNVLVFANASTLQGAIAPTHVIGGSSTLLAGLRALFLDQTNDRLYVADGPSSAVYVFNGASTANGSPPPNRRITGANTQLSQPTYLLIDGSDVMYVANNGTNSIERFASASTIDGAIAPTAVVSGGATRLANPTQFAFDSSGSLYSLNGSQILVFPNFASASGSPPPSRFLSGSSTSFSTPVGLVLDPTH